MGTPFLGEIRAFSFDFAPKGWALCNGQFLPINQNQALFALLGTMYGGNGQTTFALPDLRSRVPIHVGGTFSTQGQAGGQEFHTLTAQEMPQHTHFPVATSTTADLNNPAGARLATSLAITYSNQQGSLTPFSSGAVANVGGSQPHENRQPYLVLAFAIALIGIFPSRN